MADYYSPVSPTVGSSSWFAQNQPNQMPNPTPPGTTAQGPGTPTTPSATTQASTGGAPAITNPNDPTQVSAWLSWRATQPGHDPILDTPGGIAYYQQQILSSGGLTDTNYWSNKSTLASAGGAVGAGGASGGMGSLSGSLGQPFGQTFNMDPGNGQTYNLPSTDVNKLPSWAQPYKGTYTLPTLADLQNTPGYQFQLQQGLQGVDRGAAARGGLNTGGTLKAENNYAQGLAGTTYQNAVANSLGAFNTNYGVYQGNQSAASNAYGQQVNAGLSAFGANQGAYNNMYGNALNGFNSNFNVWNTGGNSLANRYYNLAYLGTLQ